MASERVGDMTIQELKTLIQSAVDDAVDERWRVWPGQRRDRPVVEVLESMRKHIIKRAPGQPSTLQMLREDRDR
jgi:hypothetical protein